MGSGLQTPQTPQTSRTLPMVLLTGRWSSQLLDSGRFRRSKTSHLLDCGLCALCETVGGVAQTVGSGLWRAKSFFSSGPKLPFKRLKPLKPLEPCQWFCHTGRWSSQLLDSGRFRRSKTSHLLDCGLWALCETVGGVAQTVGSGLWRAKSFFSSGPKLPFKRLNPLETCQWFCHNARWSSQLLNSGRWLDCGLWALAALDALLELPLAGLWHTISLFLAVRNGPSGLFLAYRLLHVLLLVFHLSSGDVKPVAAHCPVINLSRRDIACDQATTMRACVLMLFLFFDGSIPDAKPVAAHCPVINLSRRNIACDQAPAMRACVLMLLLFLDCSIPDAKRLPHTVR